MSDPMDELKAQVDEVGDQAIEHPADALHLFFALIEGIDMLNAGSVQTALYEEFDWWKAIYDGNIQVFEGAADDPESYVKWVDKLADFVKRAAELLGGWMDEHSLPSVKLYVYLPCHRQWAPFTFSPIETKAGVDEA